MNGVGHWLLRHTVLIVFLLFLAVGLVFRDEILEVDTAQDPIRQTLVSPAGDDPAESAPQPSPITDGDGREEMQAVSESVGHRSIETVDTQSSSGVAEDGGANLNDAGVGGAGDTAESRPEGVSPLQEDARGLEYRPTESVNAGNSSAAPFSVRDDYLEEARSAYWSGDEERAIEIYRSLLGFYPNDPDVHGELGNIFLKREESDSAFDQYREAVRVFAESDRLEHALEFVRQVSKYDPEMGKRLHQLLGAQDGSNAKQ